MNVDVFRARFDEALPLARRMAAGVTDVPGMPSDVGEVNGYPVTPADIAATIVAHAVARREGPVGERVQRASGHAAKIIGAVRHLTQEVVTTGHADGRNLLTWSLSGEFLHVSDTMYRMSAAAPGLHVKLPEVEADDDDLLIMFRERLSATGLPWDVVAAATAVTRATPHGNWTRFTAVMTDRRLDAWGEIAEAAHLSRHKIRESLSDYARHALDVVQNIGTLSEMADRIQVHADAQGVKEGAEVGKVSLHSIGRYATRTEGQRVTMHVPFATLAPGLIPRTEQVHYTSMLGLRNFSNHGMEDAVERLRKRRRLLLDHGGVRIDRTGIAVLADLGHDVEAMITDVRAVDTPSISGSGDENLILENGRIMAVCPLGPDVRWMKDHVETRGTYPDTLMQALAGRPARSVVDHPAMDGAVIRRVVRKGKKTRIHLEPRWEIRP